MKKLVLFGLALLLAVSCHFGIAEAGRRHCGRVRYSRPTQLGWPVTPYRHYWEGTTYYHYDYAPFNDRDTLSYGES